MLALCISIFLIQTLEIPQNLTLIGGYPFVKNTLIECKEINGERYAFVGAGGGVYIYNIEDPLNSILISDTIRTYGQIRQLFLKDSLLFIANGRKGFTIYNVASPRNPKRICEGSIPNHSITALFATERYLYIGTCFSYEPISMVFIFDISNPQNPVQLGSCTAYVGLYISKLLVKYPYIFAACGELRFFDASDPQNPRLIFTYQGGGNLSDIVLMDTFLFVSPGTFYYPTDTLIRIFNIANPREPRVIGFWVCSRVSRGCGLSLQDRYLLLAEGRYAHPVKYLRILDVASPQNPNEVGSLQLRTPIGNNLSTIDTFAYIPIEEGFSVVNISNPSSPSLVKFHFQPTPFLTPQYEHTDMEVFGSYVYATGGAARWISEEDTMQKIGALLIYDVSNPHFPKRVGICSIPSTSLRKIGIRYPLAFLASDSGVFIIDISNPNIPWIFHQFLKTHKVGSIFIRDTFAYVVSETDHSFKVVNISNPSNPFISGEYFFSPIGIFGAGNMVIRGRYAYVPLLHMGNPIGNYLSIIDINDPSRPQQIGIWESGLYPYPTGVSVPSDSLAVVSITRHYYIGGGMATLDISSPSFPRTLRYNPLGDACYFDVFATRDYAFIVGEAGKGLKVVDIRDPRNPTLVEASALPDWGFAYAIAVSDSFIFCDEAGFTIHKFDTASVRIEGRNGNHYLPILKIYPNPAKSFFAIRSPLPVKEIKIFDVAGNLVKEIALSSSPNEAKIPLKGIRSGVYILKIKATDKEFTQKIIIR